MRNLALSGNKKFIRISNEKYKGLETDRQYLYKVVFERDLPGVDTEIRGQLLYMVISNMETLFSRLKLKDFRSFYSADPEKMALFFNEKEELWEKGEEPPTADEFWSEEWFSPAEGLVTVRALIEAVNI